MSEEDPKDVAPAASRPTVPERPSGPDTAAPSSPESELEQLRLKLEQAEEEARSHYDRFLRERAELENFKKRMQRERADALRFACEPLIRELLPVVDNLERALEHGTGNGESVLEGVRLVLKSLLDVLERHGVKRIEAVGQAFDPTRHEAMLQVESAEHEPNRVVAQHHTGYLLHDRLLRPALVTVSGRKSNGAVESEHNSD
jgi:molecular chaperone GrpE